MQMSRSHFQFIADTLTEARRDFRLTGSQSADACAAGVDDIARRFARELYRTNFRFDEARFLAACGVK